MSELDRVLVMEAVRATEAAATAAWKLAGLGDEMAADLAAAEAMSRVLNHLPIDGVIVIGEGEKGEAPHLYLGERVGAGSGARIDIAVDPLEGATQAAKAQSGALAVMAWAPEGSLLHAPDIYMDKIAIGPGYAEGVVDLDRTPAENVVALAKAKGVAPSEITACVLDRPRHGEIIASLRSAGARVNIIGDGDIAGVIHTTDPDTGIDLYIGAGRAPEGVLACAALKCVGGQFQGRLVFRNADEKARAARLGITEPDKKYSLHEIVKADAIFAATGITDGVLLDGVKLERGFVCTHSLVLNSSSRAARQIRLRRPI